jgi:hypothetical protein
VVGGLGISDPSEVKVEYYDTTSRLAVFGEGIHTFFISEPTPLLMGCVDYVL